MGLLSFLAGLSVESEKERKEREELTDPNSLYNRLKIAYDLATEDSFSIIYNQIALKILHATTYTATSGLNTQFKAAKYVLEKRENENFSVDDIEGNYTLEDTLNTAKSFINNYVRPDIIQAKLLKILDNQSTDKSDEQKSKIFLPIIEATKYFIKRYDNIYGHIDNNYKKQRELADNEYANRTSDGMGFGIITSSISQVALFSALDAYEKNKELQKQETQIWSNMNMHDTALLETFCDLVIEAYKIDYLKRIETAIKKSYELL